MGNNNIVRFHPRTLRKMVYKRVACSIGKHVAKTSEEKSCRLFYFLLLLLSLAAAKVLAHSPDTFQCFFAFVFFLFKFGGGYTDFSFWEVRKKKGWAVKLCVTGH